MYRLPTFNLFANIFTGPALWPPIAAPRLVVPCNLAYGDRITLALNMTMPAATPWLLLPPATDVRSPFIGVLLAVADMVEVPAGSGRHYTVLYVDDLGKGFANEHRFAILSMMNNQPQPLP